MKPFQRSGQTKFFCFLVSKVKQNKHIHLIYSPWGSVVVLLVSLVRRYDSSRHYVKQIGLIKKEENCISCRSCFARQQKGTRKYWRDHYVKGCVKDASL